MQVVPQDRTGRGPMERRGKREGTGARCTIAIDIE